MANSVDPDHMLQNVTYDLCTGLSDPILGVDMECVCCIIWEKGHYTIREQQRPRSALHECTAWAWPSLPILAKRTFFSYCTSVYYRNEFHFCGILLCYRYGLALLPSIICLGRLRIACRYIYNLWQLRQGVDSLAPWLENWIFIWTTGFHSHDRREIFSAVLHFFVTTSMWYELMCKHQ